MGAPADPLPLLWSCCLFEQKRVRLHPKLLSSLLDRPSQAVAAVTGQPAPMVSVHAGLEVAQIVAKLPGLEAASIGPVIQ